jgi:biopolymer transport protein ExbD
MAFGGFGKSEATPMAEINVIPLVDIMLVLLVVFIITAPVLTHAVRIELPEASSTVSEEQPDAITLSIDGAGQMYWNDSPVQETELAQRFTAAAEANNKVELRLRADKTTAYEVLARVMATAHTHGVNRIGFITEPEAPL